MPISMNASTPTVPDVDDGIYDARLLSIVTKYVTGGNYGEGFVTEDDEGNKVNKFEWNFGLYDEDGEPIFDEETDEAIEVDMLTGLQFFATAKNLSKQVRAMKALMSGDEFAAWVDGEAAPTQAELIGRPCQVEVGTNEKGYPRVNNVLPPRKVRARRSRAAAEAEAHDEADEG